MGETMSNMYEPTPAQLAGWTEALSVLSSHQHAVMMHFPFWRLWRYRPTGQLAWVYTFDESDDGRISLRIVISPQYNPIAGPVQVFGVDPDDLEEITTSARAAGNGPS